MTVLKTDLNHSLNHPNSHQRNIGWRYAAMIVAIPLCHVFLSTIQSVSAQTISSPVIARTSQGQTLYCRPDDLGTSFRCNPQDAPPAPTQYLDGAPDMLLKLLYLGLPGVILLGISLHSLHQHRATAKKRAFLESLERIWDRSAQV